MSGFQRGAGGLTEYPMLPPITRIESVNAATVAMRSSGHTIMVCNGSVSHLPETVL